METENVHEILQVSTFLTQYYLCNVLRLCKPNRRSINWGTNDEETDIIDLTSKTHIQFRLMKQWEVYYKELACIPVINVPFSRMWVSGDQLSVKCTLKKSPVVFFIVFK